MALAVTGSERVAADFVNFESGQTRPLALSADGTRLFALNTPDAKLVIFDVTADGLSPAAEVPVGLEPISVATRTTAAGNTEVWVVNLLSDSVSIVHVDAADVTASRVVGTLLVGDEPRDVVFAGNRAFVTSARRGQHLPTGLPADLPVPGVGRALVWAYDADDPFADTDYDVDTDPSPLGGEPLTVLELFGDAPRALAASPDGSRVYAAIFHSGNQTTIVHAYSVMRNGGLPQPPLDSPFLDPGYDPTDEIEDLFPTTGLIVKFDPIDVRFEDELGHDWSSSVRLTLPDQDVFAIDATANPPALIPAETATGVGTMLFNMAVRPGSGVVYVTNTDARNHVRFEPVLRGHLAESRISIVNGGTVDPVHLNPHIDYEEPTGPATEIDETLAPPMGLVFSGDGATVFVAGFGSGNVGIFDADALEAGTVTRDLVAVGGGPSGLALDEARDRLYVLKRFEHRIAVVSDVSDAKARAVSGDVPIGFDPSPPVVLRGRRFLYDSRLSGHGDGSCATCHPFGDFDGLGWDLGDPYGDIVADPNSFLNSTDPPAFHPMKGPMTTQSLRGLVDNGPMHWRGDRSGGLDPGGDPFDEAAAFRQFNGAFVGLLGGATQLPDADMRAFADFALTIRYPPNPERELGNADTPEEVRGAALFAEAKCVLCHLNSAGRSVDFTEAAEPFPASFAILGIKVPHFRNLYQKVGLYAQSPTGVEDVDVSAFLGDQIRGFGFFHDGSRGAASRPIPSVGFTEAERDDLAAFLFGTDTGLAPAVGEQLVASPATIADPATVARRDLLAARADAGDCDLIVKTVLQDEPRGGLYLGTGGVTTDRVAEPVEPVADFWARAASPGSEQVWTCVPPGSGNRMGIDRDEDGARDADERDSGTSPDDALDFPGGPTVVSISSRTFKMSERVSGTSTRRKLRFRANTDAAIVPPLSGSDGDPTVGGATLRVYNANGSGEQVTVALPATFWQATGNGYLFRAAGSDAAVTRIVVRAKRLRVDAGGDLWTYSLDEPRQGRMALRLTLGDAVQWCAEMGARLRRGSTTDTDRTGIFTSESNAAPPEVCPAAPAG